MTLWSLIGAVALCSPIGGTRTVCFALCNPAMSLKVPAE